MFHGGGSQTNPVEGLPYVDEHAVEVDAPRDVVWTALGAHVDVQLGRASRNPLTRLLGTEPRSGFAVTAPAPGNRLVLAGRHRFARYTLTFDLADLPGGRTRLAATTRAAFPGAHGRAYRALVIGTRGHVLVTRHVLAAVRRAAQAA